MSQSEPKDLEQRLVEALQQQTELLNRPVEVMQSQHRTIEALQATVESQQRSIDVGRRLEALPCASKWVN